MTRTPDTPFTYSVAWNVFLITIGSAISAAAFKGIAYGHAFIPGGLFGAASLIYFTTHTLGIGLWFLALNVPLFVIAWKFISRRFLLYSLYAMAVFTLIFGLIRFDFAIRNQLYAAVTCGMMSGIGAGIVLRSLGSNGGLDVMGVLLYQKFNIGLGKFYFAFNAVLYAVSFCFLDNDLVIASMIMLVCTSLAMDYALSLFSQRKTVLVISDAPEKIVGRINAELKMGATFINGTGAHSGRPKQIILTVINNIQLKRLEEIVFTADEHALLIAENTFSVIGSNLARRKIY